MNLDIEKLLEVFGTFKPESYMDCVAFEALTRLKRIGELAKELDWCDFEYDPALFPTILPQQCLEEILRLCGRGE